MLNTAKLQRVFHRILVERQRQETLRDQGRFRFTCADEAGLTPSQKFVVLGEEMGEVARVLLNLHELATDFCIGAIRPPRLILNTKLRKELIEVAAVTCAWLESMEGEDIVTSSDLEPMKGPYYDQARN